MDTGVHFTAEQIDADRRYLELLAHSFGSVSAASSEIINLEAILNLPKGTEHFIADIHGENEAFEHVLRNASGDIKRKVVELFGNAMRESDIRQLCSLIYYPEQKLEFVMQSEENMADYYLVTLHQLIQVLQKVSSKYTRSKVRKALPKEFAYIIEELLHEAPSLGSKQLYYNRIIETIISTGQANEFVCAICNVIQRLSIDQLHLLGDLFDRGPGAHIVLDTLANYPHFDITWGNHDALWMGAAAGNLSCMANVLRISLRYANMATLEDGYGINMMPLATFAMETYGNDPCELFIPRIVSGGKDLSEKNRQLYAKMHKAIAVIQFKLEGQLIDKYPQWGMADRKLLHLINWVEGSINWKEHELEQEAETITINGVSYPMLDRHFPTIDPADPYRLTEEEQEVMDKIRHSFEVSDKLKRHIALLFSHGCMFNICNSNLMYHASIPINEDLTMRKVLVGNQMYSGRELLYQIGMMMRSAFNHDTPPEQRQEAIDYYWYLWCGPDSPLFDKAKMATFERYFIEDKATHEEKKGWYYKNRDNEEMCDKILDEFGVPGEHRRIITGHVPVHASKGETPMKAGGKMMVIDGGFSRAFFQTTGIAGYTLVFHSRGLQLVQHEPFSSALDSVKNGTDIVSTTQVIELNNKRLLVRDTDKGKELQQQIDELRELLWAYRHGFIKERK
ncbi:MAG: fructose-1,6-bisphosphatase [Bacteroidales bacterium]|nr:fructose-1,6-bisphosphatase [Bacteroidales bacterium]